MLFRSPWDSPGKSTGVGCHFLLQISSRSHINGDHASGFGSLILEPAFSSVMGGEVTIKQKKKKRKKKRKVKRFIIFMAGE